MHMKRIFWQSGIVVLLFVSSTFAGDTFELRGKITNAFTEAQYKAVTVLVTDRIGTELGRAQPDKSGRYVMKVTGPQFIIIKAELEGFPTAIYQLDTKQYKESTTDREENKAFGELRIQTYYQNITFGEEGSAPGRGPLTLEGLLANEDPQVVKDYQETRRQKESGDLKKAVQSLEKLTKKHPEFYIGLIDLGMILAAQQENDRAFEIFTRARALRPEHSWGYIGLGMVQNNRKDYQGATEHLEKAVALEPTSINALYQLGFALFNLGQNDRALDCFGKVVQMTPSFNPMAYKYMSSICVKKGDPEGAARALEAYLAQYPDASDRDRVERILKKLGH
jgi:tetratricopeptide (TPR) repeat protein